MSRDHKPDTRRAQDTFRDEKILTGAPAIELGDQPADDSEDEPDRITREAVERIIHSVRIEKAVVTEEGKLALLVELL
jgi:hypothetical protein